MSIQMAKQLKRFRKKEERYRDPDYKENRKEYLFEELDCCFYIFYIDNVKADEILQQLGKEDIAEYKEKQKLNNFLDLKAHNFVCKWEG